MTPLLEVTDLRVSLPTARGPADALHDVSFAIRPGETVGLIGESGSGKSMTALALMGLLPERATLAGSIRFDARELVGASDAAMCELRGNRIGMVFQEPMTALNPLHTVGDQVAEPLRVHRGLSRTAARAEALRLLERVRLPQAAQRLDAYPHQLSGGQRQRVTIAMALACGPQLLIADEPTTALDVTIQREILELIDELVAERRMALLLISHDLAVMAESVARVLVMYGGTVVESGPTASVFARLAHPYTKGLFGARPRLGAARGARLATRSTRATMRAASGSTRSRPASRRMRPRPSAFRRMWRRRAPGRLSSLHRVDRPGPTPDDDCAASRRRRARQALCDAAPAPVLARADGRCLARREP
jgi:peptide/nickel transport system ATP-binding protein